MIPRRIRVGFVVALAATGVTAVATAHPVEAVWQDREHAQAALASSALSWPTKSGPCVLNVANTTVTYSWTNPTSGAPRTGYVIGVYASGSSTLFVPEVTTPGTSVTIDTLLGGYGSNNTYDVRVQAYNNNWRSEPIAGTFTTGSVVNISSCAW